MKFSYNKILYLLIIVGIFSSFLKQSFFRYNYPNIYSFNNYLWYSSYILILISTYSLTLTNDKWNNNNILRNIYFILIAISFSWLYGILIGLNAGNNPILVFRNYMFLSLSLPAYLIYSKMSSKAIIEFSLKLPFIIAILSFLLLPFALKGIPSLIQISESFLENSFHRSLYAYTYFYASYMFFSCLLFSIAFKFERNTFQKLLEKFNILNSNNLIIINSYRFLKKYNALSIFWFLYVTVLAYFGNASILYLVFSIILYSFAKLKRYRKEFISFLVFILIFTIPYIYKYFIHYFGLKRLLQLPILLDKISFFGNGLGSEIANTGEIYGTELLILGIVVQLGIFSIPFLLLVFTYIRNIIILAWKSDSLSLLIVLSYGGYFSTLLSNPTLSYPWTYFFSINGVLLSEILKTKNINQIIDT